MSYNNVNSDTTIFFINGLIQISSIATKIHTCFGHVSYHSLASSGYMKEICGNKMPTRCNRGFIADVIACLTCFGHHYAHHQELKCIIQWLLPVVFRAVVFKMLVWCGAEGYVFGLQDACW